MKDLDDLLSMEIVDFVEKNLTESDSDTRLGNAAYALNNYLGAKYVGEMCRLKQSQVLRVKGIGRKTFNRLKAMLEVYNLSFDMLNIDFDKQIVINKLKRENVQLRSQIKDFIRKIMETIKKQG